ncbi:MAG: single-stranded-DNA-specific exonuclease RecJ [Candidatus Omnitrophica bacterium]|nr:single-stranded-DNA-specific exonuclease RecJ [Candidatus Omnitrophota bacterium]
MQKLWNIHPHNKKAVEELRRALKVPAIVAQLLMNRGISDTVEAKRFLQVSRKDLYDPFLLKDMDKTVERIEKARRKKERVLIYGDYDVDGVTSSALLIKTLRALGLEVINYIPHRVDEGYGLNHEIAPIAKKQGVSLLITVDCGITANSEIETLNALGIEVIVIDHHEPSELLPKAFAIINSKRKDCEYPCKDLAAVGTVAKLIQALTGEMTDETLNLVALGTISDVVPLTGENRIFVKEGLATIHITKNKGLRALLDVAKIDGKELSPFHVGFILGPRLNAAGRMDSAQTALDLFLTEDTKQAQQLARALEAHNLDRQRQQRDIVQNALEMIEQNVNFNDQKVIVLNKDGWHRGLLGIVASKIVEKYYRPAIVISTDNGVGSASARSIEGFHLYEALSRCSTLLVDYGGHKGAAGLTIKEENIDLLRKQINQLADELLEVKKLVPTILIDCAIDLGVINLELAQLIKSMEPYGEGNPSPVFCSKNLTVTSRPMVMGRETLKFWVTDGSQKISAVGFGMAKYQDMITPKAKIDLAYEIIIDDWNKAPTPQLKLKDIKLADN